MSEHELQQLVEEISLKYFKRPFTHSVKINRRFKITGGRYHLDDHHLEINQHYLTPNLHEELMGIIKHELTHYHLHQLGRGYKHQDQDFKTVLAQVKGSRYAPDIGLRQKKSPKYIYQCTNCGTKYYRQRKINLRKYVCGKCRHKLKLIFEQK